MKTRFFVPPVKKATGGITVIYQLARHLVEAGYDTALVFRETGSWRPNGNWENIPTRDWNELDLDPGDVWVVPEGWVNALMPGLQAKARCLSYVQNWAYLFSSLPEDVQWNSLPVSFIAVSDPVRWYIEQSLGVNSPVIRPSIDRTVFYPPEAKPEGPLRVAFMPRKNKALADQIRSFFEARRAVQGKAPVEWVPIAGMTADQVADALRSAHVFLATGFPEGCPLPPLEAMSCDCIVAGFSGFGGWDYLRQADMFSGVFVPWWPLREVPWRGNALVAADADVPAAGFALEHAAMLWEKGGPALAETLDAVKMTADWYTEEQQRDATLALWKNLTQDD